MSTQTSTHQPRQRWSLRPSLLLKQTAFVALVTIVTGGTLILASEGFARRMVRDEIDQRLLLAATDRQALLQNYIHQQEELVGLVASRTRLRQLVADRAAGKIAPDEFRQQSAQILADARRSAKDFVSISIADPHGTIITATDEIRVGNDYGTDPDFVEGRRQSNLGAPHRIGETYQSLLTAPVLGNDGKLQAVVIVVLDVQPMVDLLASRAGLGESGETLIGTLRDSTIHLLLPARNALQLVDIPVGRMPAMALAVRGQSGLLHPWDYRDVEVLAAYRPVGYLDWGLVVKIDAAEVYAPLARFRTIVVILEAAIILTGVLSSYLLARRFTRPIFELTGTASTIARGDLTARTGLGHRTDEFGELARTFDEMAVQIRRHVHRADTLADASHAFAQRARDLEALLASVAQRVAEQVGDTCTILLVSEDGARLEPVALYDRDPEVAELIRTILGTTPMPVDGDTMSSKVFRQNETLLVPQVSISRLRQMTKQEYWPLLDRVASRSLLMVPLRAQGRSIGVLSLARHRPESGAYSEEDLKFATALAERAGMAILNARLYGALEASNEDLERRVADRTAELEAANKELEAFSYSVAHDLRAPLRAMDGFSKLVVEDFAPRLPEEAQRYLGLVRDNAQQMGRLIDDLLTFSRLGRKPLDKQQVHTADLVRQVVSDLQQEQMGREVTIQIGDLADCTADPALLKQVFANLLSNALKFTRTCSPASIEVTSRADGGEPVYEVKDNGVGFDMQYAGKLFGVFQRLHRAEEYEGTGVGLAIVQRIIHRHGGRAWAEAAVDKGATFYFTLGGASHDGGSG